MKEKTLKRKLSFVLYEENLPPRYYAISKITNATLINTVTSEEIDCQVDANDYIDSSSETYVIFRYNNQLNTGDKFFLRVTLENGKTIKAKIDTGADSSSIDVNLLKNNFPDKKIDSYKIVKSALGKTQRATVTMEVELLGETFKKKFSVSDRKELKYKMLIGKDILKKGDFLVDPCK